MKNLLALIGLVVVLVAGGGWDVAVVALEVATMGEDEGDREGQRAARCHG